MISNERGGTKYPRTGGTVKVPLLPNKVGKRSGTMVMTLLDLLLVDAY